MSRNPQISIIVPVYNSEKVLDECIRSIANQSFRDFELILVNDGSTDSSGEICNKWSERDSRIICIHKKNGGVVDARNTGIRKATAKYLAFSDNDDWMDVDCLKTMYDAMVENSADMVQCNYARVIGDKYELNSFHPREIGRCEICNSLLEKLACGDDVGISHTKWNKLFVTEKVKRAIEMCNEKTALNEDWLLIIAYMGMCDKVIILDTKPLYFFRYSNTSVSASYRPGYKYGYDIIYKDAANILESYGIRGVSFEDHKYFSYVWCMYGCVVSDMSYVEKKKEIKEIISSLDRKKLKEVLDVYPSVPVKLIVKGLFYGFTDITIMCGNIALKILKLIIKLRNNRK